MFEILKIKLFGIQPVAKISDNRLQKLIKRDFEQNADILNAKLKNLKADSGPGKNRISAGIIKLAKKEISALDELIEKANIDSRDIMAQAEYPRCANLEFDELEEIAMKQIYMDDFVEYSNWLNKDIDK